MHTAQCCLPSAHYSSTHINLHLLSMRSPDHLLGLLEDVQVGGSEGAAALRQVLKIAASNGLLPAEINTVVDLILDSPISISYKNILILDCLVPRGDYLLSTEIILRVLSAVGTPEVYYKKGKQQKLKRLATTCQQRLLEWLICALPLFGSGLFRFLKRQIPVLYGLLSFEFLRPYISTLIVVASSGPDALPKLTLGHLIRPWHVQLVADMCLQFPSDPSLKALVAFFRARNRTQKIQPAGKAGGSDTSGIFMYPNPALHNDLLARYKTSSESLGVWNEVSGIESLIQRVFDSLDLQQKRRKVVQQHDLVPLFAPDSVSILSINSVSSLIAQFERITLTNPSSVASVTLSGMNRYRRLYLALYLITAGQTDQIVKKLDYAIRYHILNEGDHNSLLVNSELLEFARFQGLRSFIAPCVQFLNSTASSNLDLVRKQIKLLRYMPWEKSLLVSAVVKIFSRMKELWSKAEQWFRLVGLIYSELAFMIKKWNTVFLASDTYHSFLECLLEALTHTFVFTETVWGKLTLYSKVKFLSLLAAVKTTKVEQPWPTAGYLVPPPTLMYQLIVTTNPLILSEALGYLAFLKSVQLPETEERARHLRSVYVMDSLNFVWREMALNKEPGAFSQGMLLDEEFLNRVAGLNYFSYSNLLLLKTVGGIVQNPSFVYTCAELVWKLEDQAEGITTRHPGPISEGSVAQLRRDLDNTWLSMSYYDIKVSLLNSLDALGYTGLCDLLFSSLRPLASKRQRS